MYWNGDANVTCGLPVVSASQIRQLSISTDCVMSAAEELTVIPGNSINSINFTYVEITTTNTTWGP